MISFEDVKRYLPTYLSPESQRFLFDELKKFPNNIDKRFYTIALKDEPYLFQGDGIRSALVVNLPDPEVFSAPVMVLSNTCDIDISNKRYFHSNVVYATIFRLDKYKKVLLDEGIENLNSIENHIGAIRRQELTQIFYLPECASLENESIVFFDRVNSCSNEALSRSRLPGDRLFTLSDYGFYVFLLKLSIHFTRMGEKVQRTPSL